MIRHTGLWLKEVRLANRLKQREACEFFKVSRGTYSSWESRYKARILPQSVLNNEGLCLMINHLVRTKKVEHCKKRKSWLLRFFLKIFSIFR